MNNTDDLKFARSDDGKGYYYDPSFRITYADPNLPIMGSCTLDEIYSKYLPKTFPWFTKISQGKEDLFNNTSVIEDFSNEYENIEKLDWNLFLAVLYTVLGSPNFIISQYWYFRIIDTIRFLKKNPELNLKLINKKVKLFGTRASKEELDIFWVIISKALSSKIYDKYNDNNCWLIYTAINDYSEPGPPLGMKKYFDRSKQVSNLTDTQKEFLQKMDTQLISKRFGNGDANNYPIVLDDRYDLCKNVASKMAKTARLRIDEITREKYNYNDILDLNIEKYFFFDNYFNQFDLWNCCIEAKEYVYGKLIELYLSTALDLWNEGETTEAEEIVQLAYSKSLDEDQKNYVLQYKEDVLEGKKQLESEIMEKDDSSSFENIQKQTVENSLNNNELRFCRMCGKRIPVDGVFCPYCGSKVLF